MCCMTEDQYEFHLLTGILILNTYITRNLPAVMGKWKYKKLGWQDCELGD